MLKGPQKGREENVCFDRMVDRLREGITVIAFELTHLSNRRSVLEPDEPWENYPQKDVGYYSSPVLPVIVKSPQCYVVVKGCSNP